MILRDNKVLKQDKGQNKKYLQKPSKIFAPKGITHQKILKLMKAIMPKQRRLTQSNPHHPYIQSYMQT